VGKFYRFILRLCHRPKFLLGKADFIGILIT
jgi:hypothetical protein